MKDKTSFLELKCIKCGKSIKGNLVGHALTPISTDNKINRIEILYEHFDILCDMCLCKQLMEELD